MVCGERWEASGDASVVKEGGKLGVWLNGTFILKVADFEVEAFDLAVELVYGISPGYFGGRKVVYLLVMRLFRPWQSFRLGSFLLFRNSRG